MHLRNSDSALGFGGYSDTLLRNTSFGNSIPALLCRGGMLSQDGSKWSYTVVKISDPEKQEPEITGPARQPAFQLSDAPDRVKNAISPAAELPHLEASLFDALGRIGWTCDADGAPTPHG